MVKNRFKYPTANTCKTAKSISLPGFVSFGGFVGEVFTCIF